MEFSPALPGPLVASFWSCGTAWGTVKLETKSGDHTIELQVQYGKVGLKEITLPAASVRRSGVHATSGGRKVSCTTESGEKLTVRFSNPVEVEAGEVLRLSY